MVRFTITGCTFNITSSNNGTVNGVFDEARYLVAFSAVSNAKLGTVINPVQSARLSTRNSACSIRFGRERRCWMGIGGSNYVPSQGSLNLNWGPTSHLDGVSKSYSWWTENRTSFASDFHTSWYVLEWTQDFPRIYVDTRLHTLLDFRFSQPFFQRGGFPQIIFNGSGLAPLPNPWINGSYSTPFDQEFYLNINVSTMDGFQMVKVKNRGLTKLKTLLAIL